MKPFRSLFLLLLYNFIPTYPRYHSKSNISCVIYPWRSGYETLEGPMSTRGGRVCRTRRPLRLPFTRYVQYIRRSLWFLVTRLAEFATFMCYPISRYMPQRLTLHKICPAGSPCTTAPHHRVCRPMGAHYGSPLQGVDLGEPTTAPHYKV